MVTDLIMLRAQNSLSWIPFLWRRIFMNKVFCWMNYCVYYMVDWAGNALLFVSLNPWHINLPPTSGTANTYYVYVYTNIIYGLRELIKITHRMILRNKWYSPFYNSLSFWGYIHVSWKVGNCETGCMWAWHTYLTP